MGGYPVIGTQRLKIGAKLMLLHGSRNPFGLMCQILTMTRSVIQDGIAKAILCFLGA